MKTTQISSIQKQDALRPAVNFLKRDENRSLTSLCENVTTSENITPFAT